MKKLLFLLSILVSTFSLQAKIKPAAADTPYKKYPELPAFNIRQPDSLHIFNTFNIPKGRPVLLALFDPNCSHCKDIADELLRGIDSIKNIDMYWCSPAQRMSEIKRFAAERNFENYPTIKLCGKDSEFFFIDYFGVTSFPDFALYDEQKKFVHLFRGRVTVKELYEYTHKN
jgi:thioredoxin-related protein